MVEANRRLLLVHAHPDDETITNGATMARYAAEGAHVALLTCTLGEEGEVLVPELSHLAADQDDRLGEHRIGELAAAMAELGVADHRFLGGAGRYRDSGMMGTPANEHPDCFWRTPVDEAAVHAVAVIREVRPQVLVTYDENGGYGHPDHIQAHRVAMRAVDLAAESSFRAELGEPWQVAKVYWIAMPDSLTREAIRALRESGNSSSFGSLDPDGDLPFVVPDEFVTTEIDGQEYAEAKLAALRAHATQIVVDGPFFALSNNLGRRMLAQEHYRLIRGDLGPADGLNGWETDLFAGLAPHEISAR